MITLKSIPPKVQTQLGIKITNLPSSGETKRRMKLYLSNREAEGKRFIKIENIRKGVQGKSTTTGWTMTDMRDWLIEMGFIIRKDDRVII